MRLNKYVENIQLDLKLFALVLLVIVVYRIVFMWQMSAYMGDNAQAQIGVALWAGLRLSLKSAGGITLVSFVFATLPNIFLPRLPTAKIRIFVGNVAIFLLSVLFEARFPYYREFGMTYHWQVVQGLYDDKTAIFWTMVEQYGLFWRVGAALLLTLCWGYVLKRILAVPTYNLSAYFPQNVGKRWRMSVAVIGLAAFTFLFGLFVRFGGSFTYVGSINWENAGVTSDNFLNECIFDDIQAMYRAKENAELMEAKEISGVEKDRVSEMAQEIASDPAVGGSDLEAYLTRHAQGAVLPKPKHIFIILGESWAAWPILPQYADLHVADGIKSLRDEDDAFFTFNFMPNGDFTSIAITGVVTGLTEVVTRVNYQPRSFLEPYPTAMAQPFQELGYKVDFWYGGVSSWGNIRRLALAQGFDNFYSYADYNAPRQNTWGTNDGFMFDALRAHLSNEPPTVHLIMTISNHPPYTLDLPALGFDLDGCLEVTRRMNKVDDPEELAVELGHYWYMDRETTKFIRAVRAEYPDSLFVLTGDHAVRTNPSTTPTIFEQQAIPFLLYGAGVHKNILPADTVGGHTYIVPTLLELIAPAGFTYRSISPSMTEHPQAAFNRYYWLTNRAMGAINTEEAENMPGLTGADFAVERAKAEELIAPLRTISWYILERGTKLP